MQGVTPTRQVQAQTENDRHLQHGRQQPGRGRKPGRAAQELRADSPFGGVIQAVGHDAHHVPLIQRIAHPQGQGRRLQSGINYVGGKLRIQAPQHRVQHAAVLQIHQHPQAHALLALPGGQPQDLETAHVGNDQHRALLVPDQWVKQFGAACLELEIRIPARSQIQAIKTRRRKAVVVARDLPPPHLCCQHPLQVRPGMAARARTANQEIDHRGQQQQARQVSTQ